MRKLAMLFAVVALIGCGGNKGNNLSLDDPLPAAGTYSGAASIYTVGSSNPTEVALQSATVSQNGQVTVVTAPSGSGDPSYTISGEFQPNRQFSGTVSSGDTSSTQTNATYTTNSSNFRIRVNQLPGSNRYIVVNAALEQLPD